MRSAPFVYERANTLGDAARAKSDGAVLLAGGLSLVPAMKRREINPTRVVDIGALEALRGVSHASEGGIRLGALTSFRTLCDALPKDGALAALREAAYWIGDVQVRNRGTLGGNLCFGDPRANLPPALLATDARLEIEGAQGKRQLAIDAFLPKTGQPALGPAELLSAIELPAWPRASGGAYREIAPQPGGVPLLNIAVVIAGDPIERARVAVGGLSSNATRLPRVEAALLGGPRTGTHFAKAAAEFAAETLQPESDLRAGATYRLRVAPVLLRRALLDAGARYA